MGFLENGHPHRITDVFGVKGAAKGHLVQPPIQSRASLDCSGGFQILVKQKNQDLNRLPFVYLE